MNGTNRLVIGAVAGLLGASGASAAVTFDWATVGDPGNAPYANGYGAVGYAYQISRYEVTNTQYAEFLNAKAASDPLSLYNPSMGSAAVGGILRTGAPGSYSYAARAGYENKPVVYISWYDAVRFVNWLQNGQGNGDTETGAYTLLGGTPVPSNGGSVVRNPGVTVALPSESEWQKAAYYDPTKNGTGGYWLYPTRNDSSATAEPPPGGPSSGNFYGYPGGFAVTGSTDYIASVNYLTDVGAYAGSTSYYGTFDQGGNAWEWNESVVDDTNRGVRGGSWANTSLELGVTYRGISYAPHAELATNGFRVVAVPEPAGLAMAVVAGAGLWRRRRRA